MSRPHLALLLSASILSFGLTFAGCRDTKPDYFGAPPVDTTTSTGGRSGSGGRSGGTGGAKGSPDAAAAPGDAKPADVVTAADVGGDAPRDGVIVDAVTPSDVVTAEVPAPVPVADAAAPDAVKTGPAACFPDPKVIAVCVQLESACNNCPGGGEGKKSTLDCYAVVQKGDDAACAKYSVDKKCNVDPGGNVCGSLNCGVGQGPPVAAGCNVTACKLAQGNGDSAKCQTLLAACPCK
jgi:hypothetical protein